MPESLWALKTNVSFLLVVFFVAGIPAWLVVLASCIVSYCKCKDEVEQEEVPILLTKQDCRESRIQAVAILTAILLIFTSTFGGKIYASIAKKQLKIPREWQQKMFDNQNTMNEAKKVYEDAHEDNLKILDKIVILNKKGTSREGFELIMENKLWRLYEKSPDAVFKKEYRLNLEKLLEKMEIYKEKQ